jgi:NAD(P)-dependent dehydrogenase (short-subunit alcohol dehydrogenase family)
MEADVGNEAACQDTVGRTIEPCSHLDVLVNNAVEQHPHRSIEKNVPACVLLATFGTLPGRVENCTRAIPGISRTQRRSSHCP